MKNLSIFNKVIYVLNIMFAITLLFLYILPFLPPRTFSGIAVLNLSIPFFIFANTLFLLYWGIRLKMQFLMSFVVLIIGYLIFGSLYKFSFSKAKNDTENFKIMNYNVRMFNAYKWIKDNSLPTKISTFIALENPDILCVQEYVPNSKINLSSYKYKYIKQLGSEIGQAIFSKFKIINSGNIDFPKSYNNAIFVDLVIKNDTVRVYNIHLQSHKISSRIHQEVSNSNSKKIFSLMNMTFKTQQNQTEIILKHKANCKYKIFVCGDFNNTAYSYVYRHIKGNLNDAFEVAGSGFGSTYDFKFFPMRIDYIFSDAHYNVLDFETFPQKYSDHFPIMATFSYKLREGN